jgi:PIN domain nuclease of toxin-antitoxin system
MSCGTSMILIDTHVVLWLYAGEIGRIPTAVQQRIDDEDLRFSPVTALELAYLHQVGRVTVPPESILSELALMLGLSEVDESFSRICFAARDLDWTRDLFDRLVSAHSLLSGLDLVTKDRTIRENLSSAWWGPPAT